MFFSFLFFSFFLLSLFVLKPGRTNGNRTVQRSNLALSCDAMYFGEKSGRRERRYRRVVQRETTSDKLETRFTVSTSLPPIEFLRMRFASSLGGPLDDAATQRRNDATPCQRHPSPRRATSVRSRDSRDSRVFRPWLAFYRSVVNTLRMVPRNVFENLKRQAFQATFNLDTVLWRIEQLVRNENYVSLSDRRHLAK